MIRLGNEMKHPVQGLNCSGCTFFVEPTKTHGNIPSGNELKARREKNAHLCGVDEPKQEDSSDATEAGYEEAEGARPAQSGAPAYEVVVQQQVGGNCAVNDPHQGDGKGCHHRWPSEDLEHAKACTIGDHLSERLFRLLVES